MGGGGGVCGGGRSGGGGGNRGWGEGLMEWGGVGIGGNVMMEAGVVGNVVGGREGEGQIS